MAVLSNHVLRAATIATLLLVLAPALLAAPPQQKVPAKKAAPDPTTAALEKAAALRKEGKLEEALEVLRVATRDVKKRRGVGHAELLPIYDAAGEILVETDPKAKAESLYEKSIAIRERLKKERRLPDEAALGRTWYLLARVQLAAAKVEDALESATKAVRILDVARGPTHDETLAAWDVAARAVATCEDLLGPDDPASRRAREGFSSLNEACGRFAEAIESRRTMLAALEKRHGPDSPESIEEVTRLNRLLLDSGRAGEAIAAQERLAAGESNEREAAETRLAALRLLADLHLAAEQFTAATDACERALAVSESLHTRGDPEIRLDRIAAIAIEARRGRGPDPSVIADVVAGPEEEKIVPALVQALARAAAVLLERGDVEDARVFALRAIDCEGAWKGIPVTARFEHRLLLGRSLLALKNPEAKDVLGTAAAEARSTLGPGAALTSLLELALAECEPGEDDDGNPLPDLAVTTVRRILERGLPRRDFAQELDIARGLAAVVARTASLQGNANDPPPATLWDAWIASRARQFGEEHGVTATAKLLAGGTRLAARDPKAALPLLRAGAATLEKRLGNDHPDVGGALLLVGLCERAAGDDAAERSLERALSIWTKVAGDDNAAAAAAAHALAMTKVAAGRTVEAIPLLERVQAAYQKYGQNDAWRTAEVIVPLAVAYLERKDKERALAVAVAAAKLDCWQPRGLHASDLEQRALTLASLAGVLRSVGEEDAGTDAQRRARGLATRLDNPRPVLAEVDRRATGTN